MPPATLNDRNPFIKILSLGLLDKKTQPATGFDGGLGHGLSGADTLNVQRACRAAHEHLRMTPDAEINALAAAFTVMKRRQQPKLEGMARARAYLSDELAATHMKPKAIHRAGAEMSNLSRRMLVSRSTLAERQTAIVFFTLMYAEDGVMLNPAAVTDWVTRMRRMPTSEYRRYLDTAGKEALRDVIAVGMHVGVAAGSLACVYQAAQWAASGPVYVKPLAALSAPSWPFLAVGAALSVGKAVPLAVGLVGVGADATQEITSFAQIKFYKDAVLLNFIGQPGAPLLQQHHPSWHMELVDLREPRAAKEVGTFCIKAFGELLSNCVEDLLCV